MDELNPQMQNPNIDQNSPENSPFEVVNKHKKRIITFAVLVAVAGFVIFGLVWKYVREIQNPVRPVPTVPGPVPTIDAEVQEDNQINQELEDLNLGDLDGEFKSIDQDLNTL